MKKWLLLALAIIVMSPINSHAYSFVLEGDLPHLHNPDEDFFTIDSYITQDLSNRVYAEEGDIVDSSNLSISGRFMLISDYGRPTHEASIRYGTTNYARGLGILYNYDPTGPGAYSAYSRTSIGTALGTSDIRFFEIDHISVWGEDVTELTILTNTWYYWECESLLEMVNASGRVEAQIDFGIGTNPETPTPIPGAVWLLGSGIVGLAGVRRKMKA